jgi:hypothetical protein
MEPLTYFFYGTGAVLVWLVKGRRTRLAEELSDTHKVRNSSIAAIIWFLVIGTAIYINNGS